MRWYVFTLSLLKHVSAVGSHMQLRIEWSDMEEALTKNCSLEAAAK